MAKSIEVSINPCTPAAIDGISTHLSFLLDLTVDSEAEKRSCSEVSVSGGARVVEKLGPFFPVLRVTVMRDNGLRNPLKMSEALKGSFRN